MHPFILNLVWYGAGQKTPHRNVRFQSAALVCLSSFHTGG